MESRAWAVNTCHENIEFRGRGRAGLSGVLKRPIKGAAGHSSRPGSRPDIQHAFIRHLSIERMKGAIIMFRTTIVAACGAALMAFASTSASAEEAPAAPGSATVTPYTPPEDNEGNVIAYCSNFDDPESCGKPAADAFCQVVGFASALSFAEGEPSKKTVTPDGKACPADECKTFAEIVCTP